LQGRKKIDRGAMGQGSMEVNGHLIQPAAAAAEEIKLIIDTDPGIGTSIRH
jgi:hypothetical protein